MTKSDSMDDFQPTIVGGSHGDDTGAKDASLDVSRAKVGFVQGRGPRFADETATLLHSRLRAFALVLSIVFAAAYVGNLFAGNAPQLLTRTAVLLVFTACWTMLRRGAALSLGRLRLCEVLMLGGLTLQLMLMMYARLSYFAGRGDATSLVAARHMFWCAWSILLLAYGIFVPNTWKRAAVILLPAAGLPYLILALLQWRVEGIASALAADHMPSAVPLPLVAATMAIYGTHIINSVRREAFKARQYGQYHLIDKLGAGGMGEVYRAEHKMLKRPCAMKLIHAESEADTRAVARFEREVQATATLSHWNTIEIYDYGRTDDGTFYYVMELLPGMSLEELVERHGPLPPGRVVHLLRQACHALREAHASGLIHRDIKPANIFAACRGDVYDTTKLLDFGLVRQVTAECSMDEGGAQGTFSGSPLFMAPEQARDYQNADARCDIYALGAVAYFLLTGRPPFSGANLVQVLQAHAHQQVVPPTQVEPSVPSDLEQVVERCLAKDPDQRYQDVDGLRQALGQCQCADQWSEDAAAAWWKDHPARAARSAAAMSSGHEKTLDAIQATVDAESSRPETEGRS
jgi:serine/threonine-protein kinase